MITTAPSNFNAFFSRLSVAALLVNERGEILEANGAAARLHGVEVASDLKGGGWPGLDAQLTLIQWKKRWKQIETGESVTYDTDLLTAGELLRPVNVETVKLSPELMLLRLEDRLATFSAGQQLEQLSQAAQAGYFFYNFIDRELELSPVARELLGLVDEGTAIEDIIKRLKATTSNSDRDRVRQRFRELISEEGSFSESIHIELPEGTKSLQVTGRSVANELHVTHLLGMVREIRSSAAVMIDGGIPQELARFSIDEARDMIFWTRPDGDMAFVNQSAADYLGYDRKKLEGRQVNFIAPDFTDSTQKLFWKRLRRERAFELEYDLVTKSRKVIRISGVINYLRFGDQEYACSFCRDITEKQATDQRRVLAETTVNNAKEYILYVDRGGLVLYANQTLLDRTGLERSDIEQSHVESLLEFSHKKDYEQIWSFLSAERKYQGEMKLRFGEKDSGQVIPVSAKIDLVDDGENIYSCIYLTDWSKKKNRDAIIGLSGLALEQADEAIIWLEEDLSLRYLNAKVIQLVGGKPESWIGKDVRELLPELKGKTILEENNFEVRLETKTGETIYFDFSRTELEQDGRHYYVLTGRDVSERLRAENKLRKAYSEIQELKERLQDENISLREQAEEQYSLDNIVTISPKYRKVLHQISQVADVDTTVLITGETGTGKELLARAVHKLSDRVDDPLIKVNCAALPENLIESELFGHEKGAFTGANARKKGRFELAHRGTIFLDEIGELPLDLQSKLLRVLQEGEFERLGGTETIKVDVRLVAATNRNLAKMVAKRRFREDLYYRLNVFPIVNIPLRERPEDIEPLVKYFVQRFAKQQGKQITDISGSDLKKLKRYSFPGNIRELENLVERAVVLSNSEVLRIEIDHRHKAEKELGKPFLPFEEMQRQHIISALKKTGGRITGEEGAGRLLELNDRTLMSKMRKLRIAKRDYIE